MWRWQSNLQAQTREIDKNRGSKLDNWQKIGVKSRYFLFKVEAKMYKIATNGVQNSTFLSEHGSKLVNLEKGGSKLDNCPSIEESKLELL